MEELDTRSAPSFQQNQPDVEMEQVDYGRDSDTEEKVDPRNDPQRDQSRTQSRQYKMPTLRLVAKKKAAPQEPTLDEDEDEDDEGAERQPLPRRRPAESVSSVGEQPRLITSSKNRINIHLYPQTENPDPFWNTKHLEYIREYYSECSTIRDSHPGFVYVREPDRQKHEGLFYLKIRFNDYWQSTMRGKDQQSVDDYMTFIQRVYSACCYANRDPKDFGPDIIPLVRHHRDIDMKRTTKNTQEICRYFGIDTSRAEEIFHLIMWRSERLSRVFSFALRHDPNPDDMHSKRKYEISVNNDGSCELYQALMGIGNAQHFVGTRPHLFLMTMFPKFGKSRFEIAFVFPSIDGPYKTRERSGRIVPEHRWIDRLDSNAAARALKGDGHDYYTDKDMELYVRSISGHSRTVDLKTMGRPLYPDQPDHEQPKPDEPQYDIPRSTPSKSEHAWKYADQQDDEASHHGPHRMRRPAPAHIEEQRTIRPFHDCAMTFMFHATYDDQLGKILAEGMKPGRKIAKESPRGRVHNHLACIDDVIIHDEPSDDALTLAPAGRNALIILGFTMSNHCNIRLVDIRTGLTEDTIPPANIIASYDSSGDNIQQNHWMMKKNLDVNDCERYEKRIAEFADAFFQKMNPEETPRSEESSERNEGENKRRRHEEEQSKEDDQMEDDLKKKYDTKVEIIFQNEQNIKDFIEEFQKEYIDKIMSKEEAINEMNDIRKRFEDFMKEYESDPTRLRDEFSEAQIRSLRHVDPEANFPEVEHYYESRNPKAPTLEEFHQEQHSSGYPIRLPVSIKSLRTSDSVETIKAHTDILRSLTQSHQKPEGEKSDPEGFHTTRTLNVLTMNHGNYTKNPKLDGRELANWPVKDRPIVGMIMESNAHILCLNEIDVLLFPEDSRNKDFIKLLIANGFKGIVIKQWSAKAIGCFVRGGPHARVELLARHMSSRSSNWGTTFGMFRCFFGIENGESDPWYTDSTLDCLATTGTDMFEAGSKGKYIGTRLPPRTRVKGHGKHMEIITIQIEANDEFRGAMPKSESNPPEHYDTRHVTRAGLPFATVGVFHAHPNMSHGAIRADFQEGIMPLVAEYQADIISGDANRSANTFSGNQKVMPDNSLMHNLMQTFKSGTHARPCH